MTPIQAATLSIMMQMWASIEMQSGNRDLFTLITVVSMRIVGIILAMISIKAGLGL